MPFDVKIERYREYVRYSIAGRTSLKRFAKLFFGMATDIEQFEDDRALLDLRGVEGRLSRVEQQLIGEMVATRLPLLFKLASVVPIGEITRNSEHAASQLGLDVKVFDEEVAALLWLLEGKPT
jgi:hypothetical protein